MTRLRARLLAAANPMRRRLSMPLAMVTAWLLAAVPTAAGAGSAGAWHAAPGPAVHRASDQTATLLHDGRVLVVGGLTPNPDDANTVYSTGAYTSAELFDPAQRSWTATGSLAFVRQYHSATLLGDGRVLVVGGYRQARSRSDDLVAAAELYDPAVGRWSSAGSLPTGLIGHTATLLRDGRVLVAGGLVREPTAADPGRLVATDTAELYDPAGGRWSPAARMPAGRWEHAATLLDDGTVLLTGGRNTAGGAVPAADGIHADTAHALQDAVVFHPGTSTWTTVPHLMLTRRTAHTATLLGDGTVLIAGGSTNQDHGGGGAPVQAAEIYSPRTQTFLHAQPMLQARIAPTATLLADGRVLLVGGLGTRRADPATGASGIVDPVDSAELYVPATGRWEATSAVVAAPDTAHDRIMRLWLLAGHHTATLLSGPACASLCGQVLVLGGDGAAGAQLFDPAVPGAAAGSSWTDRVPTPPILAGAAATLAALLALATWRLRMRRARRAW